jgi:hypothetical protein
MSRRYIETDIGIVPEDQVILIDPQRHGEILLHLKDGSTCTAEQYDPVAKSLCAAEGGPTFMPNSGGMLYAYFWHDAKHDFWQEYLMPIIGWSIQYHDVENREVSSSAEPVVLSGDLDGVPTMGSGKGVLYDPDRRMYFVQGAAYKSSLFVTDYLTQVAKQEKADIEAAAKAKAEEVA